MKPNGDWWDSMWPVVTGCAPDFPCWERCWARNLCNVYKRQWKLDPADPFRPTFHEDWLEKPLHWKKPRIVFCCGMGDLFAEGVKDEWITRTWQIIKRAHWHTFVLLTKRPQEMLNQMMELQLLPYEGLVIGTSVTNQAEWDARVPVLCQIPAWKRIVSVEPMLGEIETPHHIQFLDGIICGGESGRGARPMHPDWARSLRDQCQAAGVDFYFKQWGEWAPVQQSGNGWGNIPKRCKITEIGATSFARVGKKSAGRLLDGREHNDLCWTKENDDEV